MLTSTQVRDGPAFCRQIWDYPGLPAYTPPHGDGSAGQGAGLPSRDAIIELLPRLRRYARALVGDAERADDLVQDCVERALSRWHLWRQPHDLRAWLFTIMHNIHANAVRRVMRGPGFVDLEHAHAYERFPPMLADGTTTRDELQGMRAIIVGTGGSALSEFADGPVRSDIRDASSHGVLKVELREGSYQWTFIPIDGDSFHDEGETPCHG